MWGGGGEVGGLGGRGGAVRVEGVGVGVGSGGGMWGRRSGAERTS